MYRLIINKRETESHVRLAGCTSLNNLASIESIHYNWGWCQLNAHSPAEYAFQSCMAFDHATDRNIVLKAAYSRCVMDYFFSGK